LKFECLTRPSRRATKFYTRVNIRKFIKVHRLTHPAKLPQAEAKLEKKPPSQ